MGIESNWRVLQRQRQTNAGVVVVQARVAEQRRVRRRKAKPAARKLKSKTSAAIRMRDVRERRAHVRLEVVHALRKYYAAPLGAAGLASLDETINKLVDLRMRGNALASDHMDVSRFMAMHPNDVLDATPVSLTDAETYDTLCDAASVEWLQNEAASMAPDHYSTLRYLSVVSPDGRRLHATFVVIDTRLDDGSDAIAADWLTVYRETLETDRVELRARTFQGALDFGYRSVGPLRYVRPSDQTEREHALLMTAITADVGAVPSWVGWYVPDALERASAKRPGKGECKRRIAEISDSEKRSAHKGVPRIVVHYATRPSDDTTVGRGPRAHCDPLGTQHESLDSWTLAYDAFQATIAAAAIGGTRKARSSDGASKPRRKAATAQPMRGKTSLADMGLSGSHMLAPSRLSDPTSVAIEALLSMLSPAGRRALRPTGHVWTCECKSCGKSTHEATDARDGSGFDPLDLASGVAAPFPADMTWSMIAAEALQSLLAE